MPVAMSVLGDPLYPRYMPRMVRPDPTAALRAARFRARRRWAGFRLVQFWAPDPRAPGFRAKLRAQCRAIASTETKEEREMTDAFEREAAELPGWR